MTDKVTNYSLAQTISLVHSEKRKEKKLRGLIPNFHIHVSMSDLYISTIGPPVYCCSEKGRLIMGMYKSLTDT